MTTTPALFTLADGEALHEAHPDTFWMPPLDERMALQPGAIVKLMFQPVPNGKPQRFVGERMWVTVCQRLGEGRYIGELDSNPVVIQGLEADHMVEFAACNVIDINERDVGEEEAKASPFEEWLTEKEIPFVRGPRHVLGKDGLQ